MTTIRAGVVDVCVVRIVGRAWKVLVLRRAAEVLRAGSWEIVHGTIRRSERPAAAARRELAEETGLATHRLYSVTVNPFYVASSDTVQVALVFAAIVDTARIVMGAEHDRCAWLSVAAAARRLTWPRDAESLRHASQLLRSGDAGVVEDVLRVLD